MSDILKIGWGWRDISTTEPTCIHGQFYIRISKGILDPITVTALALDNGEEQCVMLSCDITGLSGHVTSLIRQKIRELAPEVDVAKIIMNATHTHCTGDVNSAGMCRLNEFPYPDSIKIQPPGEYQNFFVRQCAEAVAEAWNNRKEGGIAYGYGYAAVAYSRKTWYLDDLSKRPGAGFSIGNSVNGHSCMYGRTDDPMFSHYEAGADHMANFLYTFDENDALTGAIINIPCPSQCSENIEMLTADYWHDVRVYLKERYGDIRILPQCAPAGDLSPHIMHYKAAQARRLKLKYGALDEYREQFHRKDIAERIGDAFTEVLEWSRKDIHREVKLQNSLEQLELECRQPTREEYENEKELQKELMKQVFTTEGTDIEQFKANSSTCARRARCREFIKRCEDIWNGRTYKMALHVVTLDDIAFVTSPFELYSDFMHRIIGRSPFLQTFNIQLADNDSEAGGSSYLATERGVKGGGYSSSRYCNVVSPKGGQQLVDATVARLNAMK